MYHELLVNIGSENRKVFLQDGFYTPFLRRQPPHKHNYPEIHVVTGGRVVFHVGEGLYSSTDGNLVIIPGTHLHKTTSPTGMGYDRYVVYFTDEDVQDLITLLGRNTYESLMQDCCLQFSSF